MATKRPRYMISVPEEMNKEIEDYRFENRFDTKSEAIQSLLALGLKAVKEEATKQDGGILQKRKEV